MPAFRGPPVLGEHYDFGGNFTVPTVAILAVSVATLFAG
jgi:hypothetical protein